MMDMDKQAFITAVNAKMAEANARYNTNIVPIITFYSRGKALGMAGQRGQFFILKFNIEACDRYWDEQVNDTIPHEIAHLICFATGLGKNHNYGWKRVCASLGGKPERTCREVKLTPARRTRRFEYVLQSGRVWMATSMKHLKVQNGAVFRMNDTREAINKTHFTGRVKFD
jgi:predicted SprT family Zn-dependent metalloprotease